METAAESAGVPIADMIQLYDSPTMISELETNLKVNYLPKHNCIELICKVYSVIETTVYLFLDYKKLFAFLPRESLQDNTMGRRELKKKSILDFLLVRLALIDDVGSASMWKLDLLSRPPRQRRFSNHRSKKNHLNSPTNASHNPSAGSGAGTGGDTNPSATDDDNQSAGDDSNQPIKRVSILEQLVMPKPNFDETTVIPVIVSAGSGIATPSMDTMGDLISVDAMDDSSNGKPNAGNNNNNHHKSLLDKAWLGAAGAATGGLVPDAITDPMTVGIGGDSSPLLLSPYKGKSNGSGLLLDGAGGGGGSRSPTAAQQALLSSSPLPTVNNNNNNTSSSSLSPFTNNNNSSSSGMLPNRSLSIDANNTNNIDGKQLLLPKIYSAAGTPTSITNKGAGGSMKGVHSNVTSRQSSVKNNEKGHPPIGERHVYDFLMGNGDDSNNGATNGGNSNSSSLNGKGMSSLLQSAAPSAKLPNIRGSMSSLTIMSEEEVKKLVQSVSESLQKEASEKASSRASAAYSSSQAAAIAAQAALDAGVDPTLVALNQKPPSYLTQTAKTRASRNSLGGSVALQNNINSNVNNRKPSVMGGDGRVQRRSFGGDIPSFPEDNTSVSINSTNRQHGGGGSVVVALANNKKQ